MNIVLMFVGIVVFGFIVNVLLKQTYNFIFFIGQKPFIWILTVTVIGVFVWAVSAFLGWSVSVPTWASTMAVFMNLPPSHNSSEEKESANQIADEVYSQMGIKSGRLLYKVGLAAFIFSCITSWILFYGEICSGNDCQNILGNVF